MTTEALTHLIKQIDFLSIKKIELMGHSSYDPDLTPKGLLPIFKPLQ